jgi:Fuc2NAc and GlcNAc transferase
MSSSIVVAALFFIVFDNDDLIAINLLMFASVCGFIIWNYPPARIFMGDVGSGFLGIMLGALALYSTHTEPVMFWVWFILLGIFVVDSTYTLFSRLLQGQKVYEAHRSHAYQNASRKYGSHSIVTLTVLIINLCWLSPWAILVSLGVIDGLIGLVISYIPLIGLAWHFNAGVET